jgi:hypothetical protein
MPCLPRLPSFAAPAARLAAPLLVALVLAAVVPVRAVAQPAFSFSLTSISISGVTPGGGVAVLGVVRERRGFLGVRERTARRLDDADADGVVTLDYGATVPLRSVWIAVDVTDGAAAVGVPGGASFDEMPEPAVQRIDPAHVWVSSRTAEALLVRPGATGGAAWVLSASDAGTRDADALVNGLIRIPLSLMEPLAPGGPPPPQVFADGDVVVRVDSETLAYSVTPVVLY